MSKCITCSAQLGFFSGDEHRRCNTCAKANKWPVGHPNAASPEEKLRKSKERRASIEAVILTTESTPSIEIIKRIEIVTAECAFGMNLFKDLFAGVRDIVGGRSEAVQKTMRDARRTALYELKSEAYEVGANAVVGVSLNYVELSSTGNMVMLVASGTAVIAVDP
jgi:uncharacterized protein YbjQ (UPF0145 family)